MEEGTQKAAAKVCMQGSVHRRRILFSLLFLRRLHSEGESRAVLCIGISSVRDGEGPSRLREQGERQDVWWVQEAEEFHCTW